MPLREDTFTYEKERLVTTARLINQTKQLKALLDMLQIDERSVLNKNRHYLEQGKRALQYNIPITPYVHNAEKIFENISATIQAGSFEQQVELTPLMLNVLELLDNKVKEFTNAPDLLKDDLVDMLLIVNMQLQQFPEKTPLKEIIENINKKNQAAEEEITPVAQEQKEKEPEEKDTSYNSLDDESDSSVDEENDSIPDETNDNSQERNSENNSAFDKLIGIIEILQDNILKQQKERKTTRNSAWKVNLLNDIKKTLLLEEDPLTIDLEHYIDAIRKVSAKKRNSFHFWAEPHSAYEAEKLFGDADFVSAQTPYASLAK